MSQYCFIHVQRRSQRRETVRKHVAALLKSTSSIPFVLQLASHESEHQHRLDPTSAYLQKKGCLQGFTTHVVTPGAFGISCGLCGWARGRRTVKKPSADDMWIYLGPTQKRDRMIDVFTSQQFAVCLKLKQKIMAPMKSNGKHLCQRVMPWIRRKGSRALVKSEESYTRARSTRCAKCEGGSSKYV